MNTSIFPHTKKSHNITDGNNFYELEFFFFFLKYENTKYFYELLYNFSHLYQFEYQIWLTSLITKK